METVELSSECTEDEGRPIQLIYVDKERGGTFVVNKEAIEILKSIDEPIGVISVCGKYRTGKSYLLNKVILNQSQKGFTVGPTINACTKGLLIWSKPLEIDVNGNRFKAIVIDSEGMGCTNSMKNNDQDSLMIFLLTLLLSSYFIYNSIGIIDESAIQNLSIITKLSNELLMKEFPNKAMALKEVSSFLPSFLWVIRDFSLRLVDDSENPLTPKDYLEKKALKEQKGSSDANKERNQVREILRSFFPNRDCYTLVRPVEDESMLQNLDSIDPTELRPEFVDGVKGLKKLIFQQVKPKYLFKDFVTGKSLVEMCLSYVNSINSGKVPSIESVWTYLCQFESEKHIKSCVSQYASDLYSCLLDPKITSESAELNNKKLVSKYTQEFRLSMLGWSEECEKYSPMLKTELDKTYKAVMDRAQSVMIDKIILYLTNLSNKMERDMRREGVYKDYKDLFADLTKKNEEFEKAFPLVDPQTKAYYWSLKTKRIILSCESIDQRTKMKIKLLEEKYKLGESRYDKMKNQYESIIKRKEEKIRELEAENDMLKRKLDTKIENAQKCICEPTSPLNEIKNNESKRKRKNSDYLTNNLDQQYIRLKEDYTRLYQEKNILKTNFEEYKQQKENFIRDLINKTEIERKEIETSDQNIKEILKSQVEENRKFREMLSNFINHKNRKALIEDIVENKSKQNQEEFETKIQELLTANNQNQNNKIAEYESKLLDANNTTKRYKAYYKLFKNAKKYTMKILRCIL